MLTMRRRSSEVDPRVGRILADIVSDAPGREVAASVLQPFADDLVDAAILHRVPGPLFVRFEQLGLASSERLGERQLADAMARMTALHDLVFLTTVLEGVGVESLAFKGQVLTTLVGRDEWERPSLDLDVLVRAADMERAVGALVEAGAILLDRNWEMMSAILIGEMHLILPAGTSLDLHWNLLVKESMRKDFTPDHEALFTTSRRVKCDGLEVRTFGAAETLVYSCIHAAISGGHRLVWLKDIERLANHDVDDWDDVLRVAESWRCSAVVGVLLQRTCTVLGLEVPPGTIERLVPSATMRRIYATVDQRRPVYENDHDESLLRLATRSVGPNRRATIRRFVSRASAFARQRTLHTEPEDSRELFLDRPGSDARRDYFERVSSHQDAPLSGRQKVR